MFVVYSILFFVLETPAVLDTITPSQSIKGGETLVSAGGTFELVFFNTANSTRRYLGIRYKAVFAKTLTWVANRETSLSDQTLIPYQN
ncbi:hypothetical protein Ddye_027057 [Dipteronia dyeriana]|uniref:Bulb-type lectin domain-containing protein n=1 Tax=Dipteronia dyeriana TaxID=168575 RepID=A0AAD9TND2_9ROSI|nr:hypothetical protein Ddye_027057 [Dipteronia dyeriana]